MKKFLGMIIALLLVTIVLPASQVYAATTKTVNNQAELKEALEDNDVSIIKLGSDIETTEKITITRPVTIDGNHHTMKYVGTFKGGKDKTVWDGIYLLQVYKTTATIRDIKLTGGNAALLVNGSNVKLEGTIDVSGNGFGGIELSQGKDVTEKVKLELSDDIKIVNTTDNPDRPTLWVPSDSDDATIEMNGEIFTIKSGLELELAELVELIDLDEENPSTGDSVSLYMGLSILGFIIFISTLRQSIKQN